MIKSMTGFGRASSTINGTCITVEMKSVNHRYLELGLRVPRTYMQLEDNIRIYIQKRFSRGKIDISVNLDRSTKKSDKTVFIDRALLQNYLSELKAVSEEFDIENDISLSDILRLPEIMVFEQAGYDISELWDLLLPALSEAADNLLSQRITEGTQLKDDIYIKCQKIKSHTKQLEQNVDILTEKYAEKLHKRMEKLLETKNIDEQRFLTEVAIMADKTAIDEEIVRINSHISSLESLLQEDKPIGKSIDNLIQELNREVNTITSKIGDIETTKTALDLKSIIEQIREQVQNIE